LLRVPQNQQVSFRRPLSVPLSFCLPPFPYRSNLIGLLDCFIAESFLALIIANAKRKKEQKTSKKTQLKTKANAIPLKSSLAVLFAPVRSIFF
jgi:hypothetical protein